MNLLEIKQYLTKVKIASLSNLCAYFGCESDLLRNMMMHWVRKGCIRQLEKSSNCGSCTQCDPTRLEIYEWVAG